MAQRNMRRAYGFFKCGDCNAHWESSHVYCERGTLEALYKQDCKKCSTGWLPYKVEPIKCRICGETVCICSSEEREERQERHVDENKPHRRDLCHKCRAGMPCGGRSDGHF